MPSTAFEQFEIKKGFEAEFEFIIGVETMPA